MKRVLVTGGSGFIGRAAVTALQARGFEVHAISRAGRWPDVADVTWHAVDLHDNARVERLLERVQASHLLHLAWFVEPGAYWTSAQNLRWVGASLNLVKAFSESGGHRAVLAGTCAEYEPKETPLVEESTVAPSTLYGVCKDAVHRVTTAYAERTGLRAAWGRIFFLYGPYEPASRLVPSVVTAMLKGNPAPCTIGTQRRDFLHVADVGGAFAALVDSDVDGPVNIGCGVPVAVRDVVNSIGRIVGRPELIQLGALPLAASEPPLLVADNRRLQDSTDWTPSYTLESGLQATVEWWQARLASV